MEELIKLMKEYESRHEIQTFRVILYTDGSGYATVQKSYDDEEVFDFDSLDLLVDNLRE